jgi:hypothetical protein
MYSICVKMISEKQVHLEVIVLDSFKKTKLQPSESQVLKKDLEARENL